MKIFYEEGKRFIIDLLEKEGFKEKEASMIAEVLISADLRGIRSHGIARLPIYMDRLKKGLISREVEIKKIKENKGTVLFDGMNSMGQIASTKAMKEAIDLAKEHGISLVGLNNSNHFGIAAYYSMMAAKEDLIGFVATNTSPLMAPFGGKKPMLGTNPFTVAIPANKEKDIVLDMATSLVPRGKVEVFKREGRTIPIGWGIDSDGKNTEDPEKVLKGSLLPVGGPKGYGMAIVIDILSGLLTGATYLDNVGALFGSDGKAQDLGMFMVCIDPNVFMDIDKFKDLIDDYIKNIKESPKADGIDTIYLPGEIEFNNEIKNMDNGIEIGEELLESMNKLASDYGIEVRDYLSE